MASQLLQGFRVLDLTDEKGALSGKMFADMGAEVIKVEPPAGCSTRSIPPFLEDRPGPDRSLYAIAYHAGKKSVTANLDSPDARALIEGLAGKSDFLVESHDLGYLDSIGLGYDQLAKRNPRLIYTSIMPFGDKGPARDWRWADLITWAAGGAMFMMGDQGKPPLEMSLPQAGLHAGAEATVAALIAHYPRQVDGQGQRIVVNMQACIVWTLMNEQAMPILHGNFIARSGRFTGSADNRRKMVFKCKDGHMSSLIGGGPVGAPSTKALIAWMAEKGAAPQWMIDKDWASWVPGMFMKMTQKDWDEVHEMEDAIEKFFMTMTKAEIYEQTLKRRLLLGPVATVADIAQDQQLRAREYFVDIDYRETLGCTLKLPGAFAKLSQTPIGPAGRAPRAGEHNREIYCGLAGITAERLAELAARGAI
ncbi:MAG TPA: CoA transferase [Candidatus Binataceae bacterium]|nr:CoA transferase [Candidatus Binataceae bacterium]